MGNVIGKAYANLRKLEADHGVLLDVDNKTNELSVTGPAANVAAARVAVENIALATSHTIGLHPNTVKLLLAQKGRAMQDLEQRFDVKIDLNRADGVLTVMAAPARAKELRAALQALQHSVEVSVPADVVPKLIGKKGETIQQLMEDTGALIDIDKVTNAVRLCGAKDAVARAKAFVLALVEDQAQRDRSFRVDEPDAEQDHDDDDDGQSALPPLFEPTLDFLAYKFDAFVEFLMANKGQQLKTLRADAGDARIRVRKDDKAVHVTGNKAQLAASAAALRARLQAFEALHWHVEVADGFVLSQLIGKKGQTIKQIEEETQVKIDIAGLHVTVVAATEDALADARARVEAIVAQNQRSVFLTSRHVIAVLLGSKRAKLNAIEKESGCKLQLPPPPSVAQRQCAAQQRWRRREDHAHGLARGHHDRQGRARGRGRGAPRAVPAARPGRGADRDRQEGRDHLGARDRDGRQAQGAATAAAVQGIQGRQGRCVGCREPRARDDRHARAAQRGAESSRRAAADREPRAASAGRVHDGLPHRQEGRAHQDAAPGAPRRHDRRVPGTWPGARQGGVA
ncbi:hypothetical protein PINS_up011070 [Pythium insidiosum]|nr:hypothetical protein PINS_up011070 [Pythium insidiosum]